MLPQIPVRVFKLKMQEQFKQYLNTSHKAGKLLINAIFQAFYIQFLSNLDQKTFEVNKNEKFRL